jgi:inner membrane protein
LDNLTHSLFGLTLARTPLGRAGRGATVALLLASNAPDIDIVATGGGAMKYLEWHRGPTHGPLGVVALGLASAGLAVLARRAWNARRRTARGDRGDAGADASFGMLSIVSMIGVACHVLMDLPTSYGTRPFSPFDWHWYAVDWMPIVDVYLLVILAAGLWFGSRAGPGARERNAAIVLALMALNYGLRGTAHHLALARGPEALGPALPGPCPSTRTQGWIDRWPKQPGRSPAHDQQGEAPPSACLVELAALPGFSSPFAWRLIAQLSNGYELHDVDLLGMPAAAARERSATPRVSTRIPNQWTPAVFQAAGSPVARTFLGFSRFPAARSFVDETGAATVRWNDMRFVASPLGDRRPVNSNLFSVRIRLDPSGQIVEEKFGPR